jgi:hypothetical protein
MAFLRDGERLDAHLCNALLSHSASLACVSALSCSTTSQVAAEAMESSASLECFQVCAGLCCWWWGSSCCGLHTMLGHSRSPRAHSVTESFNYSASATCQALCCMLGMEVRSKWLPLPVFYRFFCVPTLSLGTSPWEEALKQVCLWV